MDQDKDTSKAPNDSLDNLVGPLEFEINAFGTNKTQSGDLGPINEPASQPEPIKITKPERSSEASPFLASTPAKSPTAQLATPKPAPRPMPKPTVAAPQPSMSKPSPAPKDTVPFSSNQPSKAGGSTLPNLESVLAKHEISASKNSSQKLPLDNPFSLPSEPMHSNIPATQPQPSSTIPAPVPSSDKATSPLASFSTPSSNIMSPDFMKDAYASPTPESKSSKWLVMITITVLVLTVGAGAYYYFIVYQNSSSSLEEGPSISEESPEENSSNPNNGSVTPGVITTNVALPASLSNTNVLSLKSGENILIALKNQASFLKTTSLPPEKKFYTLRNDQSTILTSKDILDGMGLKLDEISSHLGGSWVYFHSDATNSNVKMGLVFEITPPATNLTDKIIPLESQLPNKLAGIFIDDQVVPPAAATFSQSKYDPRVRYFNLSESSSIDWAVANDDSQSFLLIGTSKDTMQNMLNLLGL